MLNFKIGQFYKDTDGDDWIFEGYKHTPSYSYFFRRLKDSFNETFFKDEDNSVTQYPSGKGIKIPFVEVEEKERDWVVGEEYECYNTITEKISKVKLREIDNNSTTGYCWFESYNEGHWLYGNGEVFSSDYWVVFKNGVPQELKDKLDKKKLTNKRKCFQKGRVYKNHNGVSYEFKKRIKTQKGLLAIFEKEDGLIYFDILYKMNNIECIPFSYSSAGMFLCADESIRNGDGSKAVRVMQ